MSTRFAEDVERTESGGGRKAVHARGTVDGVGRTAFHVGHTADCACRTAVRIWIRALENHYQWQQQRVAFSCQNCHEPGPLETFVLQQDGLQWTRDAFRVRRHSDRRHWYTQVLGYGKWWRHRNIPRENWWTTYVIMFCQFYLI